jgi:hypothetical protein
LFGRVLSILKRIWSNRIFKFLVFFIASFILYNALGGIIGNSTYLGTPPVWMKDAWEHVSKLLITNLLIITFIALLVSLALLGVFGNRALVNRRALNAATALTELDDSLLRLMTNLLLGHTTKTKEQLEREIRRLLHELLRDATKTVLGQQNKGRAAILFPNLPPPDAEHLRVIASYRLSSISTGEMRFYIGEDESKEEERGTVGVTYLSKQMRIAHIIQREGFCECDDEKFINFDEGRTQLPYRTFINVPIIGLPTGSDIDCLGVISMDTQIPNAFDSQRAKVLLEGIARRVAAVLAIYLHILKEQNYSAPYFEKVS